MVPCLHYRFFSSYGTASQTQTSQTKAPEGCHQGDNWRSDPSGRSLKLNQICPILIFFEPVPTHPFFPWVFASMGLLGRSWCLQLGFHANLIVYWALQERCCRIRTHDSYGLSWETSRSANHMILGEKEIVWNCSYHFWRIKPMWNNVDVKSKTYNEKPCQCEIQRFEFGFPPPHQFFSAMRNAVLRSECWRMCLVSRLFSIHFLQWLNGISKSTYAAVKALIHTSS